MACNRSSPLNHAVFADDYVRIAEDSSRLVKADAVLRNIGAVFALVPLKPHRHPLHISAYVVATADLRHGGGCLIADVILGASVDSLISVVRGR